VTDNLPIYQETGNKPELLTCGKLLRLSVELCTVNTYRMDKKPIRKFFVIRKTRPRDSRFYREDQYAFDGATDIQEVMSPQRHLAFANSWLREGCLYIAWRSRSWRREVEKYCLWRLLGSSLNRPICNSFVNSKDQQDPIPHPPHTFSYAEE